MEERLLSKITPGHGGCWIYTGSKTKGNGKESGGYGFFWANGRTRLAHRVAYELWYGPIPDGYEIDHPCGNRACLHPDHLEAVLPSENHRRKRKTHCVRGHLKTKWGSGNGCEKCRDWSNGGLRLPVTVGGA